VFVAAFMGTKCGKRIPATVLGWSQALCVEQRLRDHLASRLYYGAPAHVHIYSCLVARPGPAWPQRE